jgi:ankyrin repeat protein
LKQHKKKAEADCSDADGTTPLMAAAKYGHSSIFALLLKAHCSTNQADHSGNRALHWAAATGNTEVVRLLFNWYLGKQKQFLAAMELNNRRETPLHLAVREGHLDIVELFLNTSQLSSLVTKVIPELIDIALTKNSSPQMLELLKLRETSVSSSQEEYSLHLGEKTGPSPARSDKFFVSGQSSPMPSSPPSHSESPHGKALVTATPLSDFWSSSPSSSTQSPSIPSPASVTDVIFYFFIFI